MDFTSSFITRDVAMPNGIRMVDHSCKTTSGWPFATGPNCVGVLRLLARRAGDNPRLDSIVSAPGAGPLPAEGREDECDGGKQGGDDKARTHEEPAHGEKSRTAL